VLHGSLLSRLIADAAVRLAGQGGVCNVIYSWKSKDGDPARELGESSA